MTQHPQIYEKITDLSALSMFKKAISIKSADSILRLTKEILMKYKVCQQQNRAAIDLSKKPSKRN